MPLSTFAELGMRERDHIQRAVRTHIGAITPGIETMVLAEEFGNWVGANRRIDLLCLDENGCLVVVELKRDVDAHMELQALRYAAMISTMRFDQAVDAHQKYLKQIGSEKDPEESIREFLDQSDGTVALSEKVRIVLAASDFSQELTTAVLWLNKQGLDIRCVQMRPHQIDNRTLLDMQQVIPLPQAEQYQVAVREKSIEQAAAQSRMRDYSKFDLAIGDDVHTNLSKRKLAFLVVREAIKRGMHPEALSKLAPDRQSWMFAKSNGTLSQKEFVEKTKLPIGQRNFIADDELFLVDGKTYALTNQWGTTTLQTVNAIIVEMPEGLPITLSPTGSILQEVTYEAYTIRQRGDTSIEVERDDVRLEPAISVLRELAAKLHVPLLNRNGNDFNTRQLGSHVISAIIRAGQR